MTGNEPALQARGHARSSDTAWMLLFTAWLVATVSTLGALFFGEIMDVPTCVLCWYQRICMFPLALILAVGLFPLDAKVARYALPLACIGWGIALFHVLLVAGFVPERVQPCAQGVPCSETYVKFFGFVTIPLLALVAFSTIIALLTVAHVKARS